MERSVYDRMNDLESRHWWFTARRAIIASLIDKQLRGKSDVDILEAGCGSGGNLAMLCTFGNVDAFEFDEGARRAAIEKSGIRVVHGALPNGLPKTDKTYDLIGLFDVLEHIEEDTASLVSLAQRLNETGQILVTVPAFPFMWSGHDERHHHFRRYTHASLADVAKRAGLNVTRSSYFNTFLFPVAVVARGIKKLTGNQAPDDQLPANWINATLTRVFGFERHLLPHVRMPFGLSLVAVLEKDRH